MAAKLLSSGGLQSSGSVLGDIDLSGDTAFPSFDPRVFGLGPVFSAAVTAGSVTAGGTAGFEVTPGGLTTPPLSLISSPISGVVTLTMPAGYYGGLYHPTRSYHEIIGAGGIDGGMTVDGPDTVFVGAGGTLSGATLAGGSLEIASGGTAGSSTIVFSGGGGRLTLDDATTFGGAISGFDSNDDSIDLGNIDFSGATVAYSGDAMSGVLTIGDGTHAATLAMLGDYKAGNFHLADDGQGGTMLTEQPLGSMQFSDQPLIAFTAYFVSPDGHSYYGFVASYFALGSGQTEVVASGQTADQANIADGARLVVQSGGTAQNSIVASGGVELVESGGVTNGVGLGGGTLEIMSGGNVGSSPIGFAMGGGLLKLDDATAFTGSIMFNFVGSASIDLVNVAFSGATLAYTDKGKADDADLGSSALTVGDGTHVATLALIGQYTAANFHLADDGHGGTLVTEQPVSSGAGLATPH